MNVVKRPGNKVDGAIMHTKENIIALKAPNEGKGHILQIFDMDKKAKLKNIEFNENIVFWKWVNEQILAIVTTTSVYHVSIANETDKEVKVFDRSGDLVAAQIMDTFFLMTENGQLFSESPLQIKERPLTDTFNFTSLKDKNNR